jgi:transcriptional regulator with XRE-family HTH domain
VSGIAQTVGANVRRLRRTRGISLVELGRHAEVAKGTLTQLEAGRGNPTLRTLEAIARALGTDAAYLVTEHAETSSRVAAPTPAAPRSAPPPARPRRPPPQVPVRGVRPVTRSSAGRVVRRSERD